MGDVVAWSGAVRRLAIEAGKIASDLRLLSMGPRAGLAEIRLPAVQPGSSIMPGKVNPSIPEMVNQVCFQVLGCDATISAAAEAGQLELNVMMPVIAWNALHACTILTQALSVFRTRTVEGMTADIERAAASCSIAARRSRPRSARISATRRQRRSRKNRWRPAARSVSSCSSAGCWPPERLDAILAPESMTRPGIPGAGERR